MPKLPSLPVAQKLPPVDVVIIGLGAGGGVAALPLAQAGLKVVGIEAGGWVSFNDFPPDQLVASRWPQIVKKTQQEVPTVRANASVTNGPPTGTHPMMNAVGGTSVHYWAQHWRLNPWDFEVVSATTKRYGASAIPANSTVTDWPIDYNELSHITTRLSMRSVSRVMREISTARSIRRATSLRSPDAWIPHAGPSWHRVHGHHGQGSDVA